MCRETSFFCLCNQLCGRFQASQNFLRNARALFGVSVKVSVAVKTEGLADVVQKRRETDVFFRIAHATQGMLQHVVFMIVGALGKSVAQGKFGQYLFENARIFENVQSAVGIFSAVRI